MEDHWTEGGIGDAVLGAFAGKGNPERGSKAEIPQDLPKVVKMAVHTMPGSGTPEELMDAAGISSAHIVRTVKSLTT